MNGLSDITALNNELIKLCGSKRPDMKKIRALVDAGADVRAVDNEGVTPLHAAAMEGSVELGRFLIDRGADVNARTQEGLVACGTVLERAVSWGMCDFSLMLLEKGADPNLANPKSKETPLMWAARDEEMTDVVRALLARGADVLAQKKDGTTALDFARWVIDPGDNAETIRIVEEAYQKAAIHRAAADVRRGLPLPLKPAPRIRICKPGGMR
jgi:hypothetical protein